MSFSEQTPEPKIQPKQTLNERIAYWQGNFDRIPYENAGTFELRRTAAEDLDEYLPYYAGLCAYKGFAVTEHEPGTPPNGVKEAECGVGNFQGFVVAQIGRALKWQVCYGFDDVTSLENGQKILRQTYVLPHQVEIVPFSEVDDIFAEIYLPHMILDEAAEEIVEIVNHPEFIELPVSEQKYIIDEHLAKTQSNVCEWGGIEKDVIIDKCNYVYIQNIGSDGESLGFRSFYVGDATLAGNCLGVDILARYQLNQKQPITSRAQLVDKYAGLFLEVEINKETAIFYELDFNQRVFVPIGGGNLEVSFLDPAEADAQSPQ